ncbi:MAG: bifunctional 3-(3-hydroxy-phenyl)propionate/3-hydroxycinnamic acid hydroxylase [Alphaproteobacteria bacterium]
MMASIPSKTDVLVVGAGPTGLTAANLLAQAGVSVIVVDRNLVPLDMPRAVMIDDEGCRTIAAAGLAEPLRTISAPAQGSRYYDEHGAIVSEVGPGNTDYGWPKRNYFHQPELERVLREGLQRFPNASMFDDVEVTSFQQTPEKVTATIAHAGKTMTIEAAVMVAADGARSPTRTALGYAFPGEAYDQDWIVLDLARDPDQEPISKFFCDPARPWVSIPTPFGGRRYEFMLLPGENREDMLRHETLERLLAPVRPLPPEDVTRAVVYRFEARIAAQWGEGRVWLAGDAAHLTPPFAGQGMNAGLRDAHNIAWKAARVAAGADPAILESYELERKAPAVAMVRLAVAMGEIVMPVGQTKALLRDALMFGLDRFPEARDYIVGMRFKPPPRYADGLFLGLNDPNQPPASLIGQMLPNPLLDGALLDDQLGLGFALITQDAASTAWLNTMTLNDWPTPITAVHIPTDADPAAFRPLRAHRDQIMFIRPDRYVMTAFSPAVADRAWSEALGAII